MRLFFSTPLRHSRKCALLQCLVGFLSLLLLGHAYAAPAPGGSTFQVSATASYIPAGITQLETAKSNLVVAIVLEVESAELTQSQSVTRPPGVGFVLSHFLINTGNTTSTYQFDLQNGGAGCPSPSLVLDSLHLTHDLNNDGVSNAADISVPLNFANGFSLAPGESASLLLQGRLPATPSGVACVILTARTVLQNLSVFNIDTVKIGNSAVLVLSKSALHTSPVVPGQTQIEYIINATNIGGHDALPSMVVAPASTPILVNGTPTTLVLLRDLIPTGTQYLLGSLKTTAASAILLYRKSSDSPFAFRTTEDLDTSEVAVGFSAPISANASALMRFSVAVKSSHEGNIANTAEAYFEDGAELAMAASNPVNIGTNRATIGIAKEASALVLNHAEDGQQDGTGTIRFRIHVRNYGAAWLYDVAANDQMEGALPANFGRYTTSAIPGENQYTIIAGSLLLIGSNGLSVNPGFTGTPTSSSLFNPRGTLAPGSEAIVQFDARVNLIGRSDAFSNTATAGAAIMQGGPMTVLDDSVNGPNPDPDDDGNPNNNSSATVVFSQAPSLTLSKTASLARRISAGVYELDYALQVKNNGLAAAPYVRVLDNLNCTLEMDKLGSAVDSWELVAAPKVQNGYLNVSPGFTGRAACDRSRIEGNNPADLPTGLALNLTDGTQSLAPGQSETFLFTVRATLKPSAAASAVVITNKAWAAAFSHNTVASPGSEALAAVANSVESILVDPQGVIYNAATRLPVAGASVRIYRQTCSFGSGGPISPAELYGGYSGAYVFNGDGSVSMTTGVDGAYQFFLHSSSQSRLCTFGLAVASPAGSGLVSPSELMPATSGVFSSCGTVTPNANAPQQGDPTTYYMNFVAGFDASGNACQVVHNHIPLDPGNIHGLILKKEGNRRQAEFGDFVEYALTLINKTGVAVTGFDFNDDLPIGFAYVPGSARLNGLQIDSPAGGNGPQLIFHQPALSLGTDASAVLRYRVRIGVGAKPDGDAINRATVFAGPVQSNLATWAIRVSGGVFSDEAFAFGKVYLDCSRDGVQGGLDEIGVPGVRLYFENGTFVVTDIEGKWSLYGLKPVTHVLRVDETTLPLGARLAVLDHRNAGNPSSRFVDLVKGEFQKADFIIQNCGDKTVAADVDGRRAAIRAQPNSEGEAQIRQRLDPEARKLPQGDTRALAASGQSSGDGNAGFLNSSPSALIKVPEAASGGFVAGAGSGGTLGSLRGALSSPTGTPGSLFAPVQRAPAGVLPSSVNGFSTTGPVTVSPSSVPVGASSPEPGVNPALPTDKPGAVELESMLLSAADSRVSFVGLKDGDTVAAQSINVRVKGALGSLFKLTVNGVLVEESRVGKKASFAEKNVSGWEYIGVKLSPGVNELRLEAEDGFGNRRGDAASIHVVAPDQLGSVEIDAPAAARADRKTPILIRVRLTDAAGVPVTARTQLTLESDGGRWLDEDLNANERGVQVFMDGGQRDFSLLPPSDPGALRVRVTAGTFAKETSIALLPEMRPMIGVGVIEGVLDLSGRGKVPLGGVPAGAAFETELSSLASTGENSRISGRSAFFLKGALKGEYLLTASFDSDKGQKDRLFRDIRPDEFYPIYGDSAIRGFDAQSTQRLYVRIDKNRSYLLYGDFTTTSSTEVRSLSQTNRTLTGLKQVYDDQNVRATTYASNTSQTQQVEEFRALGTSGFYYLTHTGGDFVENSEQVEILVRDRNQLNIVLLRTPAMRFVDYTIEPLTRRILFTSPIASVDANTNPQSIRVTYEVDGGGDKFIVAGADVQLKLSDSLQLGVVANIDRNPANQRSLGGVTALARLGDKTTVAAELLQTQSDDKGTGSAARTEIRYQDEKLAAVALVSKTSAGFDNPGASVGAGRTDATARAEYRVDPTLAVRGEALYARDSVLDQNRSGTTLSVQKKLNDTMTAEAGVRYGQSNAAPGASSGFDYGSTSTYSGGLGSNLGAGHTTALGASAPSTASENDTLATVRARLSTALPFLPGAQAFVEGEQSLNDSDRQTLAVGANYALTDKTRAYGRYEVISGLYGPYEIGGTQVNNVGILGIESAYMDGGRVYNEYRLADSIDGRGVVGAIGVRNTYAVNEHVRLTGGLEHTRNLSTASNSVNNGTGYGSVLGESTSVTGGAEYLGERLKSSAILEARAGSDSNTLLFSGGVAYKIDPALSVLARSVVSDSTGQGTSAGNERRLQRHQVGLAYRPVDTNTWNALARYEHKSDRVIGEGNSSGSAFGNGSGNTNLPGIYTTDIVATHLNLNPQRGTYLTSRYAAKISRADDGVLASRYWAQLVQGRVTQDINASWDVGLQAGLLQGQGGALQKTFGSEIGYQIYRDIWVSGGYNFVGLTDRDLAANEYTSEGLYMRLRMKFDETALGFASADPAARQGPVATPAPLPEVPPSAIRQPDAPALVLSPDMATPKEQPQVQVEPSASAASFTSAGSVTSAARPVQALVAVPVALDANRLFAPGTSVVRAGAIGILTDLALQLEHQNADTLVSIVDTPIRPRRTDAAKIASERAEMVSHYLTARGVAASRIQIVGAGVAVAGARALSAPAGSHSAIQVREVARVPEVEQAH